jgi:hypothetical protein
MVEREMERGGVKDRLDVGDLRKRSRTKVIISQCALLIRLRYRTLCIVF